MQSQPVLEADGLRLREVTPGDVALIDSASTDPLIPLITSVPATPGRTGALAYVDRQVARRTSGSGVSFAIARTTDDVAVGHIGLTHRDGDLGRASVGYWIGPEHRGNGYAARALRSLAQWSQSTLAITRLELYVEPTNAASIATAEAADFEREGLLRSWRLVGDTRRDMWMYARIEEAR